MPLFKKGKGDGQQAASKEPAFAPIDRYGLLGLLDEVVNGGQTGVLELHEPRGTWVYGFQSGALTHASGGRVRGARQAFDLLWEFQAGEFMFTQGSAGPQGNLYIDKGRLLELLHRSQAALQGSSAPYIAPGQERVVQMPPRPFSPSPGRMAPQWQPGMPPAQPMAPGFGTTLYPQAPGMAPGPYPAGQFPQGAPPPPGFPPPAPGGPLPSVPPSMGRPPAAPPPVYPGQYAPQPGMPQPPQGMPPLPLPPVQPMPQMQPMPPLPMPPIQPGPPAQAMPPVQPLPPFQPVQPLPAMPMQQVPMQQMPQVMPVQPAPPMVPPAPVRPFTPGAFSVPPMAIPKRRDAVPTYQPPVAAGPAPASAPAPQAPAVEPSKPKDDLAALRETLVKQAPLVQQAPPEPTWKMRTADGVVAPPPAEPLKKAKRKEKKPSKLGQKTRIQLIKFLLWTMERRYSPDDHWTLKDAFEISTMELRDQFLSAFSQTLKSTAKEKSSDEDEIDDIGAGRMRGRGRRH